MGVSPHSRGRQSWRETKSRPGRSPARRHIGRWFFTLFALLLIAGMLGLMIQGCKTTPNTYFAGMEIPYDVGLAAPRLVPTSEVDALASMLVERSKNVRVGDSELSKAIGESDSMRTLSANLRQMPIQQGDALIFYVAAHGVTHDGEAYLLGSDFTLDGVPSETGRAPVKELLRALADTPAQHKLLLLDWGRVQFDPRLGVVYNNFPELVAQAVKEIDDPTLWVMLSHTDIAPPTLFREKWTLFAASLAEAMAGAADHPPADQVINLSELYSYVAARYDTWYVDSSYTPRPVLLRGSQGTLPALNDAAEVRVVAVNPNPPPEVDKDGKPVEGQSDVSRQRIGSALRRQIFTRINAQSSVNEGRSLFSRFRRRREQLKYLLATDKADQPSEEEAAEAAEQTGQDKQDGAEAQAATPAAPKPVIPTDRVAALLAQSEHPIALESETLQSLAILHEAWRLRDQLQQRTFGGFSPVDFAPHTWRRINADLLALEQELLTGSVSEYFAFDLDAIMTELKQVELAMTGGTPAADASGLVAAWQEFRSGPGYASFTPEDPQLAAVANMVKSLHSTLFEVRWIVRWLAAESATSSSIPHLTEVRDLLRSAVDFKETCSQYADQHVDATLLQQLTAAYDGLRRTSTTFGELLARDLREAVPPDMEPEQRALCERNVTALLSTPLLSAEQRVPLVAWLLAPTGEYRDIDESWQLARSSKIDSMAPRLDMARDLTELAALLSRADGALEIAAPRHAQNPAELQDVGQQLLSWDARLGTETSYYARLLADAREAPTGDAFARLMILPPRSAPQLALAYETLPALEQNQWHEVLLRISAGGEPLQQVFATVRFAPELLSVADAAQPSAAAAPLEWPSGRRITLEGNEQTTIEWPLRVMTKAKATRDVRQAVLSIQLAASGLSDHHQDITFALPLPQSRVRLQVRREGSGAETSFTEGVSLRPFPNRTTGFEFYLANPSLEERKIQVDLYSAPPMPPEIPRANGRFFQDQVLDSRLRRAWLDEQGRLKDFIRRSHYLFGTAAPVVLPAGTEGQRIELRRAEPATTPPAEGQPAPAPEPLSPLDRDISGGLLAVLTDADRPDQQWVEWLEIMPLRPGRYLQPAAAFEENRIVVRLSPIVTPIDLSPEKPISVQLEAGAGIPAAAERRERDKISSAAQEPAVVWVAARPDGSRRRVSLHVDGVPRAFEFEVVCEPGGRVEDVRIGKLAMNIATLTPSNLTTPGEQAEAAAESPPLSQPASNDPDRPNVFHVCDRLRIDLEADAPETRFDFVELIPAEGRPQLYYTDRSDQTRLIGEGSTLLVSTTVGDLQASLDVQGRQGLVTLKARALDRGESPTAQVRDAEDVAYFILDGTRPTLTNLNLSHGALPKNAKLQVDVAADDGRQGSGIAAIAVGFDVDNSLTLDEKDQPVILQASRGSVELDPSELKEGRTYRVLAVATDRVGLTSKMEQDEVTIQPPLVARPKPKPTKGDLRGTVSYRGVTPVSANQVTVRVEGLPVPPQATGPGGSFHFRDVPVGKYTLVADGTFSNMRCEGKLENAEVPSAKPVVIVVDKPK